MQLLGANDSDDALIAELRHTNELLTSSLIEANDILLGLYSLMRYPKEAADFGTLQTALASQIRIVSGASAFGIAAPGGAPLVDTTGADPALIGLALEGRYGSGICPSGRTGLAFDLFVRSATTPAEASYVFAMPEGKAIGTAFTKLAVALVDVLDGFMTVVALHEHDLRQSMLEQDATAAAELAKLSLPATTPSVSDLDIEGRYVPARLGGGDILAWHQVGDDLVFAVGDVAGKGLPASVVMTVISEKIRAIVQRNPEVQPDSLIAELSLESADYLNRVGLFVTIVAGRWSSADTHVLVANAGHSPVCSRIGGVVSNIEASCPPVGVLREITPTVCRIPLAIDDVLVFGSDGIIEQEDEAGDQLGESRFHELLWSTLGSSAASISDAVFAMVEEHGGEDHGDDQTLLVLRRTARTSIGQPATTTAAIPRRETSPCNDATRGTK